MAANKSGQGKVLRIGILQDGNVVQERLIKAGDPVTIGESPKNTFVFPHTSLPSHEFLLFEPTAKGYRLRLTEGMQGKISSGGAVVSLKKALTDPSIPKEDGYAVLPLTDRDRGKISIDTVSVLFQFVVPPPVTAVQQVDFRPRLIEEDDPVFLGFLGIWMALGLVLAIWVWRTEPREFTLDDVSDEFVKLIVQDEVELPPEEIAPLDDAGKQEEKEVESEAQKEMKGAKSDSDRVRAEAKRRDELVAGSPLLLKYLGTKGESRGGVVANMWSDEEQGLGDIDAALSQAAGATGDAGAATRGGNAGGNAAAAQGPINQIGGGRGGSVAGPAVRVKPRVSAGSGSVDAVAGDENQVKVTVGRYTGQLQYCYERVLKVDPTLDGRVEIGWSVSSGIVTGKPYIVLNTTGSQDLADCVVNKIRRWEFPADVKGDMSWPFVFTQKR